MSIRKAGLAIIIGLMIPAAAQAVTVPEGSQYTRLGGGVREMSLGYTGLSDLGSIEGATMNPAALGDLRRVANSLTVGGFGSSNILFNVGFAAPTLTGVYSVNLLYQNSPSTLTGFGNLVGIDLAISKAITGNLFWGFALKSGYADGAQPLTNDWYLGCDMGIVYRATLATNFGIGFNNFAFGLAFKNLGKTVGFTTNEARYPAMGIGFGASFYPFYYKAYKMRLAADINIPWNPFDLTASIAMENVFFDMFKLRAAYEYTSYGMGPYSLGLGFTGVFLVENTATDIDINYALQSETLNGVQSLTHWVNLSVAWGYYDDKAPAVATTPNFTSFSPNYDGSQDAVTLALNVRDNTMVRRWEVEIRDGQGNVVKTFKSVDELQMVNLTLGKFLRQIFSRKKQVEIPNAVSWSGQDEEGNVVPDGTYVYVLKAWDENDNLGETVAGEVAIDTVVPAVAAVNPPVIFSPNGDGSKDDYVVPVNLSNIQASDQLIATVRDASGRTVRTYAYNDTLPASVSWDGKNESGQPVSEGVYDVVLETRDIAGNATRETISQIQLVTNYQTLKVAINNTAFSPNNDGNMDSVVFKPTVSDQTGLDNWELRISDSRGTVVKKITGAGNLPDEIVWNGMGANNARVADGVYTYQLELFYDSGNHPVTEPVSIKLDTTPTRIQVTPEYLSFSPNWDNNRDTLTFQNKLTGESNDTIELSIRDSVGNIVFYGAYPFSEFAPAFKWDGLDRNLKPLPEGAYTYTVAATDAVGNRSETNITGIILKTGLEKVSIQSDVPAISPNNAGANQVATFKPELTSTDRIVAFTFEVLDSRNNVIRKITSDKYMPTVTWDGRDNNGYLMPDGEYTYRLTVKYDYGDEPVSVVKKILIDTKPPVVEMAADYVVFSPNNDGRQETLTIRPNVTGNPGDVYVFTIKDSTGAVVRTYKWEGVVPREIIWDGRDASGRMMPSGNYTADLTATDAANNRTTQTIGNIRMVREFETIKLECVSPMLAPVGGGDISSVQFNYDVSSAVGLKSGELVIIKDSTGKVIRRIPVTDTRGTVAWDGRDETGNIADDGTYTAEMRFEYDSGNVISSSVPGIILDRTAPAYKLTVTPEVFTPDGDGDADYCYINLELNDPNGVKEWSIKIYKKVDGWQNTAPFATISGTGNVKKLFQWDGSSSDGQDTVESVQDYVLVLTATDNLGNALPSVQKDISVGVLVEATPEGLRIRISSIRFESGKYNLTAEHKIILDKVIYIIRKILSDPAKYGITPNYRIEVSGHTDDVGSESYNQTLSENRASSVYNYLVSQNVNPSILTYKGYGESRPFKDIAGLTGEKLERYRAMNRRVEFFIRR